METIGGGGGRTTDAEDITSGTFVKERIPPLPTTKITEGTFNANRIPTLPNLKGTVTDAKIPDLDTLSYSAAFADAQIPNLAASKITSGTFALARIPGTLTGKDADSVDGADAGVVANEVFKIPTGIAQGDIFHVDAGGSVVKLSAGTTGYFLKTQGAGSNPQWAYISPGGGDMYKGTYDTDGDGVVDNSERLGNNTLGSVRDHNVAAAKITSGTIGLVRIPVVDDARIPNLETLSYGGAFAEGQIPNLPTTKITSGTFNADRIPILPTDRYGSAVLVSGTRFMEGTFNMGSHPIHAVDELTFTHDAKFYTATAYEVELRSKDEAYYAGLRMGHLKKVYNINTYGTLDMNGHPLIDVPTPTSGSHAANKTYVDAAKQFWVPVTAGQNMTSYGNYPVCHLSAANHSAYMSFYTPDDFHSITEAKVVVIPRNSHAAADWEIWSHYGAAGESYFAHFDNDTTTTYNVTSGQIFEVDISGILTSLAAGDYVGIKLITMVDFNDVDVLGIRFKYT